MNESELATSELSKVIVWQTYRHTHTDRQTPSKLSTPLRGSLNM